LYSRVFAISRRAMRGGECPTSVDSSASSAPLRPLREIGVSGLSTLDYSVIQQCMHCGMCLPTCPTYDATLRERNSPRGRIALMRAVADGQLAIGPEFADEMSYCLGCLACQTACPAGVNYAVLLETARTDIEQSGAAAAGRPFEGRLRAFWRRVTLGFLFVHPRALRTAGALLRWYQRSGLEWLARRTGLVRLLPRALARLEPQTPRIAPRFSHELIAPVERPEGPIRHRVLLLTGCVQDIVFSDVNRDTADVLLANGCQVETPPLQPCCGSLHAHNGEREGAQTLARRMLDLIAADPYDAIITNAGGCGTHLRHYSALLRDDAAYRARAEEWDRNIRDVHEYLVEIGARPPTVAPFDSPAAITYHDSCHLAHGQRIVREPRALLRLVPGIALVDLPEASWCCGSAGIYNITQPEQSAALLDRKVRNIAGTAAQIVAAANPGCQLQISRGLRAAGARTGVLHPVSLLARAYRREPGWRSKAP
jgi:glycolate oxidase iron-sulfur subunit